jgi:hypothetical protein
MKILKFFMDLQDFLNLSKAVITTFFAFLQIIIFMMFANLFSLRNAAGYLF